MKKGLIITAVILILAGAVIFGAALFAVDFDFTRLDTAKYVTNTYTLDVAIDTFDINTVDADIRFRPSEDGTLKVVCVEQENVRHQVKAENGVLKITVSDTRDIKDRVAIFSFSSPSVTVYLPSGDYAALKVSAVSGNISVPGPLYIGEVQLSVTTGDIECTELSCKTLTLTGTTGDVKLKNSVASESFYIKLNTGDVRFDNCDAAQITVKTTTGDVKGTLRSDKVFIAKATTGKVSVPDTVSGGQCEITTTTGDIKISIVKD